MKLIIVTGQTATGKTALAYKRAKELDGELINCDSRQIYKYLTIITGKDVGMAQYEHIRSHGSFDIGYYMLSDKDEVKIWLYDVVKPNEYYSSFDYASCAIEVIKDILHRGKTPILVGGAYFYIQHLLYDMTHSSPPDQKLRESLAQASIKDLQHMLAEKSPEIYKSLNHSELHNPQRLIRKIEIARQNPEYYFDATQTITLASKLGLDDIEIECTGLYYESKDALRKAISTRTENRLQQGAIAEVESILAMGYTPSDPGLKTIGYAQLIDYIQGRKTKDEAVEEWITKELQYAKRQWTFMKKDPHIQWIDVSNPLP